MEVSLAEHSIFVVGGDEDEKIVLSDELLGRTCRITCNVRGDTFTVDESDFFEALRTIRRRALEPMMLIPFCYGASLNVWPSGMARDMGLGRQAYKMREGAVPELVGIFDTGPDVIPAYCEQQAEYADEWFRAAHNRRKVEGYVLTLKCRRCGSKIPHAVFSGDTDMATDGLVSLSSVQRDEIIVAELNAAEWAIDEANRESAACERVSTTLARTDLRPIRIIRWENSPSPRGMPFALFRKTYKPPVAVYACPKCGGEAKAVQQRTWSEFALSGGCISPFGELKLHDPTQFNRG